MLQADLMIPIAARADAPETELFIKSYVQEHLGKRDVILLISGGPGGNHAVYLPLIDFFFRYADVILLDLRGCGYSKEAQVEDCTLDKHIEDIDQVRKYLKLTSFIFLGASYGAMVAVGYATRYSQHLKKLILVGGSPSYHFIEIAKQDLLKRGNALQKQWGEKVFKGEIFNDEDRIQFFKVMAPFYSVALKHHLDQTVPTGERIPYNVALLSYAFKHEFYHFDFRPQLAAIMCPVLLLSGRSDWINPPVCAIEMAQKIPDASLCVFEECSHFIWVDQPFLFRDTVAAFLEKNDIN